MTIDLPKELATAVQEGRAVLFLGAGASRGAMDDKLQPIPDGSGLAKILIKEFLGDDYDGLDLRSVYDLACSERDVRTVQRKIFDILNPFQPADFHLLIPTFAWAGIATTNYDLVVERACQRAPSPLQKLVPHVKDGDGATDQLGDRSVLYVKLHGCIAELNAWLEDQCIAYAKRTKHPEFKERTIWDVFQEERASLMELRGPFDGFVEKAVRASTTCLIMADHNRYSVDARAAGRMVLVRSHAERIVVLLGEEAVADHPRCFRRDQIIYDPWHYLPVLMKKPGALRNGAPFKDWNLPPALTQVRAKLKQHADGDRQFVKVLGAVLDHGLAAVESACAEALEAGIASGDVILTVLARRRQPTPPPSVTTPEALRLKIEPVADCGRYDRIRKIA